MKITTKTVVSLIPLDEMEKTYIFLTMDDIFQPKFGNKFENKYKLFDHATDSGYTFMNGHCIVSMTITILMKKDSNIKYLTMPLGYRIYDKPCTKLELTKKSFIL